MKKNLGSQSIGVQMISSSDGSAFTSTVTVYVTGDAGGQAIGSVASGVCTSEGNGYHTYLPSQAETDYNIIAFTFIGTGAIPVTIQVETGFPQTVDNDVLAAGSTGFAAIDTVTSNIETDTQDLQTQIGAAGAGLTAINLPDQTMDITGSLSGNVGGIAGTINTLDALDTAQDTQHSTTQTHLTDVKGATWATTDSLEAIRNQGDSAWITGNTVAPDNSGIAANQTDLNTIIANLATIDTVVDGLQTDLDNATDGLGALKSLIDALNDASISGILTTQMTESYAADGAAPTISQALMMIQQMLTEFAISGTTLTVKKLDGTTTAATMTLDDGSNPTSLTRAT